MAAGDELHGNTRILDKLAYVIRERFRIRGKIRALTAEGMVLCNPRDKEAAHRAQMEGIATDDRAAVTCRKCLALLYERDRGRKGAL